MAVGVVTSAILARNLGADDYGVVGIAMIVIGFLGRFSDIGMGAALVQRRKLDDRALASAQFLNLILAAGLTLCALLAAPFTPIIFKNPEASKVVAVLSGSFLITAIGFLPTALLTREMRFGTLRAPLVTGALVRGVVSVVLALTGWKYWSLVIGTLIGNLTTSLLLRFFHPIHAKWRLDRSVASELLRFGLPICFSGVLVFLVFNIDNFVIGSFLGTKQLGYYTIALTWATYGCSTVYETVHSVLFPRFSQSQHSRAELSRMYQRSLRAVVFIVVMANAVLFTVAPEFLFVVLGKGSPRWLPSLVPFEILLIYGALRASMEPVGNVVMALGQSKLLLRAVVLPIVVELSLLPFVVPRWGLPGAAIVVTAAYSLQWIVYGPFLSRELHIRMGQMLRFLIPSGGAALAAILVGRAAHFADPFSFHAVALRSAAAIAVFVLVHELFSRGAIVSEIAIVAKSKPMPFRRSRQKPAVHPPAASSGII